MTSWYKNLKYLVSDSVPVELQWIFLWTELLVLHSCWHWCFGVSDFHLGRFMVMQLNSLCTHGLLLQGRGCRAIGIHRHQSCTTLFICCMVTLHSNIPALQQGLGEGQGCCPYPRKILTHLESFENNIPSSLKIWYHPEKYDLPTECFVWLGVC